MDTRTGEIFEYDEPMTQEKRRRMKRASENGELVEVSARVAALMKAAQAFEDEQRRAKRKAAKAARKLNRK